MRPPFTPTGLRRAHRGTGARAPACLAGARTCWALSNRLEDLEDPGVEVVDFAGDEAFGVPFGPAGAADGGVVVGVGVGGGEDPVGGAVPGLDPLVVVPQGVELDGVFAPGGEGAGAGGGVVGAGVRGDEPVPLLIRDGLVGELLDLVSEVVGDLVDDAEGVADGLQPVQAVAGVADLDPGVGT